MMDLGVMVEGRIDVDPRTGAHVLRIRQEDGSEAYLDVQAAMARYGKGTEVRFIMTPMAAIAELAKLVGEDQ